MDSSIQDALVFLTFNPFFTVVTFGYYLKTVAGAGRDVIEGRLLSTISVGAFLSNPMGNAT